MEYPWEHHWAAVYQGEEAFRAFLNELITLTGDDEQYNVLVVTVKNDFDTPLTLGVEPIAEFVEMPPRSRYDVVSLSYKGYTPSITVGEANISVWGVDLYGMAVFSSGVTPYQSPADWQPPTTMLADLFKSADPLENFIPERYRRVADDQP